MRATRAPLKHERLQKSNFKILVVVRQMPTRHIVDECVKNNTILNLSPHGSPWSTQATRTCVAFCRERINAAPAGARKACILAPTVPLVRHYFNEARRTQGLHTQYIIGTAAVDAWERQQWREVVEQHELLLITPQLFLDALNAKWTWMSEFCALTFIECQHCIGTHPFGKIVEHLNFDSVRVLGIFSYHKRKNNNPGKRKAAMMSLENALHANWTALEPEHV